MLSLFRRSRRKPAASFRPTLVSLDDRLVPSGLPASWNVRGAGGGGALFSPQINPTNPSELFVSSDMSQLFHSTNSGASWQQVPFRQIQGNHETQVQYTEVANLVYALDYTDEVPHAERSTDGGLTWSALKADPTFGEAIYLSADPTNHNRLVVTDYQNVYFSANGGDSWTLKYTAKDSGAGLVLGGAFWDGTNITLGTNDGLVASSNGGTSFALQAISGIPSGEAIRSFSGAKQGGTTRFVAVTDEIGDVYGGVAGYDNNGGTHVYTLDVGSKNWTARSLPASAWPYFTGMALNNASVMYVAGGSDDGVPIVYKSTNGGSSWSPVLNTTKNANVQTGWSGDGGDRNWGYGELAMGFAVSASDPNRVIITDYGFAHSSADGGVSWKNLNVAPADLNPANAFTPKGRAYHDSGLDNTTSWGVTWADANNLFISNSDVRGQLSKDGGNTFGFGYSGHTLNSMYRVVAHPNGKLYGATGSAHDLYQSTYLTDARIDGATGQVLVSPDKGATWQLVHDFGDVVSWVAADPNNPERLYASVVHSTAGGIYVTNNLSAGAASTWTKLGTPPRTEGHAFNIVVLNDGTLVVTYSGRRNSSGAFTASSGVFVSTNGGQTWADRSDAGMRYWTKDVVIDPHDPSQNTWYVGVFSGWGGPPNGLGGLYKTTNRGQTWTKMLGNLDRVTSATFNPNDANELFVTTEVQGLWYSNNIRSANPTFTQVANYPFRQPERVFFNPYKPDEIWITSFGGGVMVGTTDTATNQSPVVGGLPVNAVYVENAAPTILAPNGTVADADSPNLAGGKLTVSLTANGGYYDRLTIRNQGTGAGQVGVNGSTVTFAGVAIGTFTGGNTGTAPLVITFNSSATPAIAQAVLRNVRFANVNENATVLTRTVRFVLTDGDGGTSTAVTESITITPVNDAPTLGGITGPLTYTALAAPIVLAPAATVADVDSVNFATGKLTVSLAANGGGNDRLAIRNQGTGVGQIGVNGSNITFGGVVIGTFTGGNGVTPLVITFNANATVAATRALVRNITFANVFANPSTNARTVRFVLTDGDGGTSAAVNQVVTIVVP